VVSRPPRQAHKANIPRRLAIHHAIKSPTTRQAGNHTPRPLSLQKIAVMGEKDLDEVPLSEIQLDEGEELPSEEDLRTLRRVSDKIPYKAYTVAFVELAERMSYYGTTAVFTNFIAQPRETRTGAAKFPNSDNPHPGALDRGQAAAANITTFNSFWVYMMPLFGAYIADTYWGRYKTICVAVLVAVIGHSILVVSAAPAVLDHPQGALAAFMIGILIMGVGTGGFKPNISPMIAEQLPKDRMVVRKTKAGERVLVDPSVTYSRVYNW
jgi:proton-dependent oligopeptide transporter, POT family